MIAGKRRGVGSGGDFCARGGRRLHAGKRVIARQSRSVAGTGFCTLTGRRRVAGRCAAGMTDVVALRGNRGNRRTRMRGDDAGTAHLRRVRGRRNGGMAVIVVERQRRIFRRYLHVLPLLRRRRHVLLVDGGNLLRRRLRCRATAAPIVTHVGDVVDDDGLVVDVADLHVRDVVDGIILGSGSMRADCRPTADLRCLTAIKPRDWRLLDRYSGCSGDFVLV